MIITFCGHSDFCGTPEHEKKMLALLESIIGEREVEFYLGEYGNFDAFAYGCCKKYKQTHSTARLIFITPYLDSPSLEYQYARYDTTVYPELENVPKRFAISHRNRYMINHADVVITYVNREFGGAYQTYSYAKKSGKQIIELLN